MSKFLSEKYADLAPYTPGEQPKTENLIKLNTNESPYPPSPAVLKALNDKETSSLRLYPDPTAEKLVKAIADFYGLDDDQIIVGNGSDELLAFSFMAFQKGEGKIYYPEISYGFYPVYSRVFMAHGKAIPLDENLKYRSCKVRGSTLYQNLSPMIIWASDRPWVVCTSYHWPFRHKKSVMFIISIGVGSDMSLKPTHTASFSPT